jgi:hypothetical protein
MLLLLLLLMLIMTGAAWGALAMSPLGNFIL